MLGYLDCFSGVSGDMLLGAMLDAGLPLDDLRAGLATLPLAGYTLTAERVVQHGVQGTRAHVTLTNAQHAHRRLADIAALLDAATLPERAHARALAIFRRLAVAEGAVHGVAPDDVTFHEVGAVDSIVDVVGVALGLELLGVDDLYCSELPLTSGRVRSAHGALPVPAPAALELLKGTEAVWRSVPTEGELVTPTGAAVAATLATFARPSMRLRHVGYGFGSRALPWANCLRLLLGEPLPVAANRAPADESAGADITALDTMASMTRPVAGAAPDLNAFSDPTAALTDFERDEVVVIESNIDNMTGEALGWLLERLLAAGALDAGYTPLQMKKQRPGVTLTVVAAVDDAARLAALIVRESATLGVRMRREQRVKAARRQEQIETPLGAVRVKLKLIGGAIIAVTPEYDDCQALAAQLGVPLATVVARVTQAARDHYELA